MAEAYGDVEKDDGVLVIRRILVKMLLKASSDQKETIERVFGLFADRCPIYRTLRPAIEFRLELELLPED